MEEARGSGAQRPFRRLLFPLALALTAMGGGDAAAGPPGLEELAAPREDGPAELPEGFADRIIARGITGATGMAVAPDGRVFVCEQTGALRVIEKDRLLPEPALLLEVDSYWERGLLGAALDPDCSSNGWIYLLHVVAKPYPHHRLSRFTLEGNRALPGSGKVLLEGDDQTRLGGSIPAGHQGGGLRFGKDGKLYLGIGEQTAGAPAQRLDTFQGKILRIGRDGVIPPDNPFYARAAGKYRAIWAYGLRNPFGFDVDPPTGRIFINDVGGSRWEEINEGTPGANYGWPETEGPTTDPRFRSPLHAYGESATQSITGGAFYEPPVARFPAIYRGRYFFAEFIQGWIRTLDPARPGNASAFAAGLAGPVDLRVAPDGSLYCLVRNVWVKDNRFRPETGSLHRLFHVRGSGEPAPMITGEPRDAWVAPGQEAAMAVTAEGAPPLSYRWQKNGRDVPGAGSPSVALTGAAGEDGGLWRCIVSNAHGAVVTRSAALRVVELRPGDAGPPLAEGLLRDEYEVQGNGLLVADPERRIASEPVRGFELPPRAGGKDYGASFRGVLEVERDGAYTFELVSGGWAKLLVASAEVAATGWPNGPRRASGVVGLRAGRHALRLDCVPGPGRTLELAWSGPGFPLQAIPSSRLHRRETGEEPPGPSRREIVTTLNVPRESGDLPPLLSQTGIFVSLRSLTPAPGLVPYEVNSPLWSDGAVKRRWIALPGDGRAGFSANGAWHFPPGTVFVKHFELADAGRRSPPRRLETRILVVGSRGSGYGATYRWRSDETDADLLSGSLEEEVPLEAAADAPRQRWYYPSPSDCLICHTAGAGFVLGANTRQLNRPVRGNSGEPENQLRSWIRAGLLRDAPEEAALERMPRLVSPGDAAAPLADRARSYLDANCSHCHRPGGVRGEFDARSETPLERQKLIGGNLVGADLAIPGAKVIVPGDRSRSMAWQRMSRRIDVFNMPPLATLAPDRGALEVMGTWIDALAAAP